MPHDQSNLLWPILGGLLIILANAFFVTVEFAIVTVRRGQMERMKQVVSAVESVVATPGYRATVVAPSPAPPRSYRKTGCWTPAALAAVEPTVRA